MRYIMVIGLLVASSVLVRAQALADGAWTFTLNSPMGTVSAKVEMKTEGDTLSGTFDVNGTKWPIEQGTVKGDTVAFVLNRPGASMTYDMQGKISGDSVTGTAAAMGATVDWSMVRTK